MSVGFPLIASVAMRMPNLTRWRTLPNHLQCRGSAASVHVAGQGRVARL